MLATVQAQVLSEWKTGGAALIEAYQDERGIRRDSSLDFLHATFEDLEGTTAEWAGSGPTAVSTTTTRATLTPPGPTVTAETLAASVWEGVNTSHKKQTSAQFASMLGVQGSSLAGVSEGVGVAGLPLLSQEAYLGPVSDAFVRQNASLIKSVRAQALDRAEAQILEGLRGGLRNETIAKNLRASFGLSKSRAALIARDQVGKLQGELTELRQVNAGIDEYIWDSSKDERVRPTHQELDGTTQKWSDPPAVAFGKGGVRYAHPGGDYQCRCNAIPVMPAGWLEAASSVLN
ncbi:MAG: minor capsid protein [Deltaproteobacteria bacterium]|nr:minor capsid protein [Deltaproteobacteria bacterium]